MAYHVYFRRPNDCVVYAPATEPHEVSLLHRRPDSSWHCALCDSTACRHAAAAERADTEAGPVATPRRDAALAMRPSLPTPPAPRLP